MFLKNNDPLYHLGLLKVHYVISWLVRLFNKVKNIKIFVWVLHFLSVVNITE